MLARVAPLAAANFALLIVAGLVFRFLSVSGMLPVVPAGWGPVHAGLFAARPDTLALLVAINLGFFGAFAALALSKSLTKRMLGARVINAPANNTEAWLLRTVRTLATRYEVGLPEVAVRPSPREDVVATGISRNHMLITVSSRALDQGGRKDVEAALAREISYMANGRLITFALVQGALNTFVVLLAR